MVHTGLGSKCERGATRSTVAGSEGAIRGEGPVRGNRPRPLQICFLSQRRGVSGASATGCRCRHAQMWIGAQRALLGGPSVNVTMVDDFVAPRRRAPRTRTAENGEACPCARRPQHVNGILLGGHRVTPPGVRRVAYNRSLGSAVRRQRQRPLAEPLGRLDCAGSRRKRNVVTRRRRYRAVTATANCVPDASRYQMTRRKRRRCREISIADLRATETPKDDARRESSSARCAGRRGASTCSWR